MIGVWADTFFRAGLHMVIGLQSRQWPAAFLADRKAVFADLDFDAIAGEVDHARARLRACACALDAQLADGRPFVEGDRPSLADIHAYAVPWFARAAMPEVNDLLACFERLPPWEARVADLGEGNRTPIAAAAAHELARRAPPRTEAAVDPADPQRLWAGQRVVVEPDDSRRGVVAGDLVVATAREIAVRHRHAAVGEVIVHFPRLGYRVTPG
jgi:glutathione S-transferase